ASSLSALADLLVTKRLFPEAKQYHTRALDMRRGALGEDHPGVALSRNSLALISLRTNHTADGLAEARRATSVLTAHSKREAARGAAIDAADAGVLDGRSLDFRVHLLALQQALGEGLIADKDAAAEAFITGQWTIRTAAGKALSQLALRAAGSSPELQELVRRRQDHASDWKLLGHELVTLASAETAGDRAQQVAAKKAQRDSLEREIGALDGEISERFPDFAALSDASPLSVERVQQRLRDDEALVQFLTGSEQTHVWVVSKRAVTWRTLPVREADLDASVQRLRCGLDVSEWTRESTACMALIRNYSVADANSGKPLPFDGAEAHNLYRTLFGEVARDISGRHLIVVPTGALARFPMQVLVTEKPANGAAFKDWQWLGAAQPLTVLPSVASLEPLRAGSKNAVAQKPFLGFGNPLLTGANGTDRRAFDIMACRDGKPQFIAAGDRQSDARGLAVAPRPDDFSDIIRRQAPLPETADELCRVASVLGADNAAVKLGKDATESEVKRLSGNGQISEYSVLHFATHGLKAGDLAFMQEPSLLMTPPQTGDGADDGLLTASEIARLKLNSDFIVLSACNTAAGQNAETEALSGLARAFLYAGSRGMLVSHWPVNSQAAVEIVTRLFAISVNASDKSRAEAMRTVLSGLARSAQPARSHPSYWAPFVMLGAF
ncbi:MAG: CHAT domain-containing protein, partial [Chitinophagales bacterium]|nr:CHAT domain-containing protein [Hyphomicrobiales bacterium]